MKIKNIRPILLIRRYIYLLLSITDRLILRKKNHIVVLCYHSIGEDDWRFSVSPQKFKEQILYLYKNYKFITAQDLLSFIKGNKSIYKPSVLLCFDDGYKELTNLKLFLKLYSIKPVVFVLSEPDLVDRHELGNQKKFLSNEEIMSLIENGWSVGSHGATHKNFSDLNVINIRKEIFDSKINLENKLNYKIRYFSYPKGIYNNSFFDTLDKAGYEAGFTMDDKIIDRNTKLFAIPRIGVDNSFTFEEFKATLSPSVVELRRIIKTSFLGNSINKLVVNS